MKNKLIIGGVATGKTTMLINEILPKLHEEIEFLPGEVVFYMSHGPMAYSEIENDHVNVLCDVKECIERASRVGVQVHELYFPDESPEGVGYNPNLVNLYIFLDKYISEVNVVEKANDYFKFVEALPSVSCIILDEYKYIQILPQERFENAVKIVCIQSYDLMMQNVPSHLYTFSYEWILSHFPERYLANKIAKDLQHNLYSVSDQERVALDKEIIMGKA